MRRVQHEQIEARRARGQQTGFSTEQFRFEINLLAMLDRIKDGGIAWDQSTDRDVFRGQRAGLRADDIGEPASLNKRKNFRSHRQNVQWRH
jgi:hypothetical protein